MKKLMWFLPAFLSACEGGNSSGTTEKPVVPEPRPQVENSNCEQVKLLGRTYSGTPATFYINTLVLSMESLVSQCSPQEAAVVLDKKFSIECSQICVVKEK